MRNTIDDEEYDEYDDSQIHAGEAPGEDHWNGGYHDNDDYGDGGSDDDSDNSGLVDWVYG